jgi:hypothetical protein
LVRNYFGQLARRSWRPDGRGRRAAGAEPRAMIGRSAICRWLSGVKKSRPSTHACWELVTNGRNRDSHDRSAPGMSPEWRLAEQRARRFRAERGADPPGGPSGEPPFDVVGAAGEEQAVRPVGEGEEPAGDPSSLICITTYSTVWLVVQTMSSKIRA